jgi:hypothetical protein
MLERLELKSPLKKLTEFWNHVYLRPDIGRLQTGLQIRSEDERTDLLKITEDLKPEADIIFLSGGRQANKIYVKLETVDFIFRKAHCVEGDAYRLHQDLPQLISNLPADQEIDLSQYLSNGKKSRFRVNEFLYDIDLVVITKRPDHNWLIKVNSLKSKTSVDIIQFTPEEIMYGEPWNQRVFNNTVHFSL